MRVLSFVRGVLLTGATVGLVLPSAGIAAGPTVPPRAAAEATKLAVYDVALQTDGGLRGQVVDGQGVAAKNVEVAIGQGGKIVGSTHTDHDGRFQLTGLRGGVYQVATPGSIAVYRLWSEQTAPPAAKPAALIVDKPTTVRGNLGNRGFIGLLSNPWFWGGLTATAIAVPLLLQDHDDDDAAS